MELFTYTPIELLLLTTVSVLFIVQFIYYWKIYSRIHSHNVATEKGKINFSQELPPLSVILYAHNEAENLQKNLKCILEQDYPTFEVIVINDASTDETETVLERLEKEYKHLYHSFTPNTARYISHKKLALTLGIKASKYEWLVFTEANCIPSSDQWLQLIARNYTPNTQIVLGYSNYAHTKGWFHKKITFDTLMLSMRYLGFALSGNPYMGIGRNLSYRKELFFNKKGYSSHLNLQRGEDDLFINQFANKENTRIETSSNAIVRIQPIEHKKEWKEEKISYMTTSHYYQGMQRYINGLETTSRLLFHACCISGIVVGIVNRHWVIFSLFLLLWALRYTMQAIIINRTAKDMNEGQTFYFTLPAFDLLQPIQTAKLKLARAFRDKEDFMRK